MDGKRERLAELMNARLGVTHYSASDRDIVCLPEPVLDELIQYYDSPLRVG